jgi:hypothetical protein
MPEVVFRSRIVVRVPLGAARALSHSRHRTMWCGKRATRISAPRDKIVRAPNNEYGDEEVSDGVVFAH